MSQQSIKDIDDILPQTQCQQCSFAGCLPYAKALHEGTTTIDRCAPGGIKTMESLAASLAIDPAPYYESTEQQYQPPSVAAIREAECIGCMKCINACPVDAIIGSGKVMHTVLTDICTGCNLCVEPCPMDCIDMLPAQNIPPAAASRQRYNQRQYRLSREKIQSRKQFKQAKQVNQTATMDIADRKKAYIEAAIKRSKANKESKQHHE